MNILNATGTAGTLAVTIRHDVDKFTAFSRASIAPLREPFTLSASVKWVPRRKLQTGFVFLDDTELWRVGFAGVDLTLYVQADPDFALGPRGEVVQRWHESLAVAAPTQVTSAGLASNLLKTFFISADWNLEALGGAFRSTFGPQFVLAAFKTGQRSSSAPCEHQFAMERFEVIYLHLAATFSTEENSVCGWSENNHEFSALWNRSTPFPTTVIGHLNRSCANQIGRAHV